MSLRDDLSWMDQALCAKVRVDPDLFSPTNRKEIPEEIRELCGRCPVRVQCDAQGRESRDNRTIRVGMPLSQRGHRPSRLKYVCTRCGVPTHRKSKVCPGCDPGHRTAITLGGTRRPQPQE